MSARTTYAATDLYGIYDRIITMKKQGHLNGPVIVNNSYQLSQCAVPNPPRVPKDHPYAEIVRQAVSDGIVMIFAAGNNHADLLCGNPADAAAPNTIWAVNSLDEVFCVGAVNWDGSNTVGAHANSSRGPGEWAETFLKPDCVAPCFGDVLWGSAYRKMEWWGTSGSRARGFGNCGSCDGSCTHTRAGANPRSGERHPADELCSYRGARDARWPRAHRRAQSHCCLGSISDRAMQGNYIISFATFEERDAFFRKWSSVLNSPQYFTSTSPESTGPNRLFAD